MDNMGPQVTCRDKPVRSELSLNRKIPGLRLRRTQMFRHHGELPEWRKLGVRVEDWRGLGFSRGNRPPIVQPLIISYHIQSPPPRDGRSQAGLAPVLIGFQYQPRT